MFIPKLSNLFPRQGRWRFGPTSLPPGKWVSLRYWVKLASLLLVLALSGCSGGLTTTDIEQPRLDTPAPRVEGQDAVGQTFVAHAPGLAAIEFLLAVYPDPPPAGNLTLRLFDDQNNEVARMDYPLATLRHNDPVRFEFTPQTASAGRSYRFTLSGPPGNPATIWSSKSEAYAEGSALVDGAVQPGDLNFKTHTRLDYAALLGILLQSAWQSVGLLLPVLGVFFLPGYLLLLLLGRDRLSGPVNDYTMLADPAGRLALSAGLSMAVWPLLFLILSLTPLTLNSTLLRWLIVLMALVWVWQIFRQTDVRRLTSPRAWLPRPEHRLVSLTFMALLVLITGLRMLHILGLAVSPWVDSIQHAIGVEIFVIGGRLPTTWGPHVLDSVFYYHFGFHAITAVFTWATGLPIEQAMLLSGQLINTLVAVGAYLLTSRLTGRRGAGLVALAIVGAVTLMPAYYLTWGRYTQLTGLALLPAAATLTFDVLSGRPPIRRRVLLSAIAVSAVFVTHYRVLLMLVGLVTAYLIVETAQAIWERRWLAPLWLRGLLVGSLVVILTAPWSLRIVSILVETGSLAGWFSAPATFNTPHWELLALRYDRQLLILSAIGAALSMLGVALRTAKVNLPLWTRPRVFVVLTIAAVISILATNPGALGLSNSWVFSNDSLIITAFYPLAILTGYALAGLMEAIIFLIPLIWGRWVNSAAALALVGTALWTADGMLSVVNPVTVLATRDDLAAAAWIRANTPPDAKFIVNTRLWQEGAYAASDAGGWLPVLADRAVTLPPISYAYATNAPLFERVTRTASVVAQATKADDLLPLFSAEGARFVYIGAKGGALRPDMFIGRPDFRQLYTNGSAWVFEVVR